MRTSLGQVPLGLNNSPLLHETVLITLAGFGNICYNLLPGNPFTEESEGMLLENNSILKPGKLTNIRTYNHQHAFLLFSSLCLNISGTLATKRSSEYNNGMYRVIHIIVATSNQDYRQSAVNIHLSCLKLLTFCLRASLCGAAGMLVTMVTMPKTVTFKKICVM